MSVGGTHSDTLSRTLAAAAAPAVSLLASSGVAAMCASSSAPFLGKLPLNEKFSRFGDAGEAIVRQLAGTEAASAWCDVAARLVSEGGDTEGGAGLAARVLAKHPLVAAAKSAAEAPANYIDSESLSGGLKRERNAAGSAADGVSDLSASPTEGKEASSEGTAKGATSPITGIHGEGEGPSKKRRDDVPEDAPEACPGTSAGDAGKASACAGCPN